MNESRRVVVKFDRHDEPGELVKEVRDVVSDRLERYEVRYADGVIISYYADDGFSFEAVSDA